MSFLDFPKTNYIKTVDTGEVIRMGTFKTVKSIELTHIRVTIYVSGSAPTNERFRINVCSERTYSSILYQSNWVNVADIPGVTADWFGWVRADFDRQNINKNRTYYPSIELDNYSRIPGSFYIGFAWDFPFPIYNNSQPLFYNHPLQMQIFGYVPRSEQ